MPCRSGLPSDVRGGVHVFAAAAAFAGDAGARPVGACATITTDNPAATIVASAAVETSERWLMEASLTLRLLAKRAIQQLFGELHALEFQKLGIALDATIEGHADLPRAREHF